MCELAAILQFSSFYAQCDARNNIHFIHLSVIICKHAKMEKIRVLHGVNEFCKVSQYAQIYGKLKGKIKFDKIFLFILNNNYLNQQLYDAQGILDSAL